MKYTKDLLQPIVESSFSYAEVLSKLGKKQAGGTQAHIIKAIKREGLDTSHFKGKAWNKGKTYPAKYPTEDYLSNSRYITSDRLKKRLIKEKYLEEKCNHCGLIRWMDRTIPLELHHKDCDHHNNSLDNLEILCPNCHALVHKSQ